jgi:hypothetical protein
MELILSRRVWSWNEPGQEGKPVQVDRSADVDALKVGDRPYYQYAAPGIGGVTYLVERVDAVGAWGRCLSADNAMDTL